MIIIGDTIFKTQKETEDFIRKILYKHSPGRALEGDDLVFICNLLECHPDRESKVGVGVKSIITEDDKEFGKTRHFSIVRIDGSIKDFSFKKCISSNANQPIKLFKSAARRAIADQITNFRDDFFRNNQDSNGNVACQLTGVSINKNNSHIDHIAPYTFDKIVSDFITLNKVNINDVKFVEPPNGIGKVFYDSNLSKDFADYHKEIAKLRVISPIANLTQKKNRA